MEQREQREQREKEVHAAIDKARPKNTQGQDSKAKNTKTNPTPTPEPNANDQQFQVVEDKIDDIPDPTTSMTLEQYFDKMRVHKKKGGATR